MRRLALLPLILLSASAQDWPRFRGPSGQGNYSGAPLPTQWSTAQRVAWKTPIPGLGWSSPIVAGNRIFLTTATNDGKSCHIRALDTQSGRVLWNTEVLRQDVTMNRKQNSFATPTPVTDGKRVYAVFAGGGIAAVDFNGKLLWRNNDVGYYSEHGLGASPVLYRDLLIMPFDGSSRGEDKRLGWQKPWDQSFLLAVDTATGKTRWRASRGTSRIGHVTPNFLSVNGVTRLISAAGDVVQAYEPYTGERLWSTYSQGEGVVPSIVTGDGLIFTSSGFEKSTIRAFKPDGSIAWEQVKGVPHIPSYLYLKPYLYTLHEQGIAMCLRAESGDIVWQERIGGSFWSSPISAGDLIYFLDEDCQTTIIRASVKFEIVARNPLEGRCQASPAASRGALFIRSADHLWAIR
jgi:outer membrane protein assembly factor BamB